MESNVNTVISENKWIKSNITKSPIISIHTEANFNKVQNSIISISIELRSFIRIIILSHSLLTQNP